MDLVVHQMVELEEVNVAHGHRVLKHLPGASVIELGLAVGQAEPAFLPPNADLLCIGHLLLIQAAHIGSVLCDQVELLSGDGLIGIDLPEQARLGQQFHNVLLIRAVEDRCGHLPAQRLGGPAQVNLQHLSDVHTGGHA